MDMSNDDAQATDESFEQPTIMSDQNADSQSDQNADSQSDPNAVYQHGPQDLRLPKEGESHITIWGTAQSGKTVFLAMLIHALSTYKGANRWTARSQNPDTDKWRENIYLNMVQNGIFPPATLEGQHAFPEFHLKNNDAPHKTTQMIFIDAPGELFSNPKGYADMYGITNPIEYLRKCKGILFLLDPTPVLDNHDFGFLTPIVNTLTLLSREENQVRDINQAVAFCITKCDTPGLRYLLGMTSEQIADKAGSIFGDALMGQIQDHFKEAKWFACSALGFEENKPVNSMTRWDGRSGITKPQEVKPINLRDSFVHLLDQIIGDK
jgi:hypothetical protein